MTKGRTGRIQSVRPFCFAVPHFQKWRENMKIKASLKSVEAFAKSVESLQVAVLPNMTVFRWAQKLNKLMREEAIEIEVARDTDEGTIYVIRNAAGLQKIFAIRAHDGHTEELIDVNDPDAFTYTAAIR
jgi:hypothetical protein